MTPPPKSPSTSIVTIAPHALAVAIERIEIEMNEDRIRAAAPDVARACGLGFERIGSAAVVIASHVSAFTYSRAIGLGIESPATEDELDAAIGCLAGSGAPEFYVTHGPHTLPATMVQWMTDRGLERHNQVSKLWRDVSAPRPVNTGLVIDRIDKYQAEAFARLSAEVFQFPAEVARWLTATVGRARWTHYLAFDRAKPVATAAMFVSGEVACFGMAATLESHRGQGAQLGLIARRIRDAAAQGCRIIAAETTENTPDTPSPSFRNLKRAGFQVAYPRINYIGRRS